MRFGELSLLTRTDDTDNGNQRERNGWLTSSKTGCRAKLLLMCLPLGSPGCEYEQFIYQNEYDRENGRKGSGCLVVCLAVLTVLWSVCVLGSMIYRLQGRY